MLEQAADIAALGNHLFEGVAGDVALNHILPQDIDRQRQQRAVHQAAHHRAAVFLVVLHQPRHVAVVAERRQQIGQRRQCIRQVAGLVIAAVEQHRRLYVGEHIAHRHHKGDHHPADQNGAQAIDGAGRQPDYKRHQDGKHQPCGGLADTDDAFQRVGDDRAAGGNVGVGEDVQHKGNGHAVNGVPAFAQQIFDDGMEAGAAWIMQCGFQDHQAGNQHAGPGINQQRHGAAEPHARSDDGNGEHAGADGGACNDHRAAEYRRAG
ncbi:hypothetical protein D3C79_261850 [compost metagenome]